MYHVFSDYNNTIKYELINPITKLALKENTSILHFWPCINFFEN